MKKICIHIPENMLIEVSDGKIFLHIDNNSINKILEKVKISFCKDEEVIDEKNLIIYDGRKIELGE